MSSVTGVLCSASLSDGYDSYAAVKREAPLQGRSDTN